jgi:DNA polymerase-3 subunit delta|tara:strand:+ start:36 stop:1040 length:1005 start_codon:yes stop_codon:yes gene_type:complete
MIIKSYLVEKDLKNIEHFQALLIYGENDGLKNFFKKKIRNEKKNHEVINLFQDEILKNNQLLSNEVNNTSLFTKKKIIFVQEASDKILNIIEEVLEGNNNDISFFIFSGILDKKSKLRSFFEKSKKLSAIACYQDNERTLLYYIGNELKGFKGLTPEIINLIIYNSDSNRSIINQELDKIKQCFDNKIIERDKLINLLNIKFSNNFSKIRDAILLGEKTKVNTLIGELDFLDDETYFYINQISTRVSKLIEIKNFALETKNEEDAIEYIKPKIFWKDKPLYIMQLKKWNKKDLESVLLKIGSIELQMKKNSHIKKEVLLKNFLINICNRRASFS